MINLNITVELCILEISFRKEIYGYLLEDGELVQMSYIMDKSDCLLLIKIMKACEVLAAFIPSFFKRHFPFYL